MEIKKQTTHFYGVGDVSWQWHDDLLFPFSHVLQYFFSRFGTLDVFFFQFSFFLHLHKLFILYLMVDEGKRDEPERATAKNAYFVRSYIKTFIYLCKGKKI